MTLWRQLFSELQLFMLQPITLRLEMIMSDLSNVKSQLTANLAKMDEISGDIDELQAKVDELNLKVQELQAQQPDNAAVADIVALSQQLSEKMDTVAAKVPEPETPTPEEPAV